jgi:hypothetical protein
MTQHLDVGPHRRGDTIYISVADVVDSAGAAITLSDYSLRAVLKLADDVETDDSDALASVTHGAGITVSGGNDLLVKFPASATESLTENQRLVGDVQATKTADVTEVRTLLTFTVDLVLDSTKTSP